jgi:hypothetical protein
MPAPSNSGQEAILHDILKEKYEEYTVLFSSCLPNEAQPLSNLLKNQNHIPHTGRIYVQ